MHAPHLSNGNIIAFWSLFGARCSGAGQMIVLELGNVGNVKKRSVGKVAPGLRGMVYSPIRAHENDETERSMAPEMWEVPCYFVL